MAENKEKKSSSLWYALLGIAIIIAIIFGLYKACNRPQALGDSISLTEANTAEMKNTAPQLAAPETQQAQLPQAAQTLETPEIDTSALAQAAQNDSQEMEEAQEVEAASSPEPAPQEPVKLPLPQAQFALFTFDADTLTPQAQEVVTQFAKQYMDAQTDRAIIIEGFTCDVGVDIYNIDLATRRAESVKQVLTDLGIAEDKIKLLPYGEAKYSQHLYPSRREYRRINLFVAEE